MELDRKSWRVDTMKDGRHRIHYFDTEEQARAFAELAFQWGGKVFVMRPLQDGIFLYTVEDILE